MKTLKKYWLNSYCILLFFLCACTKTTREYNFEAISSGTNKSMNVIINTASPMLFVAGGMRWQESFISSSLDSGKTWNPLSLGIDFNKSIYSSAVNHDSIVFCGDSGIWIYFDSLTQSFKRGQLPNWADMNKVITYQSGLYYAMGNKNGKACIMLVDYWGNIINMQEYDLKLHDIVYCFGKLYICGYGVILRSDSSGNFNYLNIKNDNFKSILSISTNTQHELYIVGYNGSIYYSKDEGENWTILKTPRPSDKFTKIKEVSDTKIWAIGMNGLIVEIDKFSKAYIYVKTTAQEDLNDLFVYRMDANTRKVILAGSNGLLWQTIIKN